MLLMCTVKCGHAYHACTSICIVHVRVVCYGLLHTSISTFQHAYRLSSLFPTNNRVFLTFEPDHLTVPDTAPLPLQQYSLYYTPTQASDIIDRALELLGLNGSSIFVRGFDGEEEMVDELLRQDQGFIPGCFVHGAGEMMLTHTHTVHLVNSFTLSV